MARSEIITDAWEVTKTYAGRIAEWVLFGCMIMNIIEILPGVTLWPALSNIVLGTQVVRPKNADTTSLGAAFLGGLGAGIWESTDAIKQAWKSVDKMTSEAFVGMWRARVAEFRSKYMATAAAGGAKP